MRSIIAQPARAPCCIWENYRLGRRQVYNNRKLSKVLSKMHQSTRPRILIIAQIADPFCVSVPLVGWSHSRAIANLCDVHVVTDIDNLHKFTRAGCVEGDYFTVIDSRPVQQPIDRLATFLRGGKDRGWTTVQALSVLPYYYFEQLVWRKFGRDLKAGKYDVVHRITPLSPTIPSLLAGKCRRVGVPFIVGPLNGGLPWPQGFDTVRREEKDWLSYVREAYKLVPGYRSTRKDAAAILVGSRATWEQVPAEYRHKCVYIPENAIAPHRFAKQRTGEASTPIKVIYVGRLVPYKGADMLLEAAAPLIRDHLVTLEVIGEGPDMPKLKAIAQQEGITNGVELAGWVEHDLLQERLANADVFAFPSIREFGGAVVIEAMAVGLVPVVMDYGGPGEMVAENTGYTIPMAPRPEIIKQFRQVLTALATNPSKIGEMGQRARRRVFDLFTWEAKALQTLEVYKWVLGDRPDKPDFGMPIKGEIGHGE